MYRVTREQGTQMLKRYLKSVSLSDMEPEQWQLGNTTKRSQTTSSGEPQLKAEEKPSTRLVRSGRSKEKRIDQIRQQEIKDTWEFKNPRVHRAEKR